jgi:hypothetical protein
MNEQSVVYPYNGILLDYRRNEILIPATTYMNLQNIIQSEGSHSQKTTILYDCIYVKYPEQANP